MATDTPHFLNGRRASVCGTYVDIGSYGSYIELGSRWTWVDPTAVQASTQTSTQAPVQVQAPTPTQATVATASAPTLSTESEPEHECPLRKQLRFKDREIRILLDANEKLRSNLEAKKEKVQEMEIRVETERRLVEAYHADLADAKIRMERLEETLRRAGESEKIVVADLEEKLCIATNNENTRVDNMRSAFEYKIGQLTSALETERANVSEERTERCKAEVREQHLIRQAAARKIQGDRDKKAAKQQNKAARLKADQEREAEVEKNEKKMRDEIEDLKTENAEYKSTLAAEKAKNEELAGRAVLGGGATSTPATSPETSPRVILRARRPSLEPSELDLDK